MKRSALFVLALAVIATTTQAEPVSPYKNAGYADGGVVLRMSVPMGSVLNAGEKLDFRFQTKQDAFVIIFNIDTEGYVHLLRPTDRLEISSARQNYEIPGNDEFLLVSGETGIEFIFALTIPDRSFIDEEELNFLSRLEERPLSERYRIDGDPFLAANMIAGEVVRGITRRDGIYFDYTYFYINERVAYPCYLCGQCEGDVLGSDCELYRITGNFDRESPMRYPLQRAYDMVDPGEEPVQVATEPESSVDIDFYPYRAEVRYISQPWYGDDWYWGSYGWYDPWYSGWYYYPGSYPGASIGWGYGYWGWGSWCGSGWNIGIGWGWGWGGGGYYSGCWSGYYCSTPYRDPYYGNSGSILQPDKFKARRDSDTIRRDGSSALLASRRNASSRDPDLRIGSRDLRSSSSRRTVAGVSTRSSRANTTRATRTIRSTPTRRTTRIANSRAGTTSHGRAYTRRSTTTRSGGKALRSSGQTRSRRGRAVSRSSRSGSSTRSKAVGRSTSSRSGTRSRATTRSSTRSRGSKATTRSNSSNRGRSVKSSPRSRSSSRSRATSSRSGSRSSGSKASSSRGSSRSGGGSRKSGRR